MSIYDKASLVLIPSGTKTSKVYSQKPVNGDGDFTFSRSTAATRVNADGNIEKETQNLLLQSNSFDTTWINSGTTETSGQAGYDGTNNAWEINKISAGAYRYIAQIISASGVQTASFYVKAGTLTRVGILVGGGDNPYVSYDLSTGTILAQRASVIDSSITDVGSGWYRCTMTYNVTISDINIYPDWDQTNTGTLYIQDAQLEQGLVARDYIETTTAAVEGGITDNVPRLDYTDSSCPALLLEPQRTNIVPHSEYINDASWGKNVSGGTLNVTSNYGISPDGSKNATRIEASITSGYADIVQVLGTSSGTAYTYSVYLKSLSGTPSIYFIYDGTANRLITLTTEWKKYTFKIPSAPTIIYPRFLIEYGLTSSSIDILAYGAQLEQGSYATSYIPTYGTSVTRNSEESSKSGVSELIGQTEGTIYAEFFMPNDYTGNEVHRISLSDGSLDNWVFMSIPEVGDETRMYLRIGASTKVDTQTTNSPFTHNQVNKIAYGYKRGDLRIYINGVSVLSSSTIYGSFTLPLSRINITGGSGGNGSTQNDLANNLNQIMVFKTRLSNEELAALTTI